MDTLLQAFAAIGGLGGCVTSIAGVGWYLSSQRARRRSLERQVAAQRKALEATRVGCRTLERRLLRQFRQTEILTAVEDVLAARLAEVEGGAAKTKKSEARAAAVDRLGGEVAFNHHVTSPTSVRGEIQRLQALVEDLEQVLGFEEAEAKGETPIERPTNFLAA